MSAAEERRSDLLGIVGYFDSLEALNAAVAAARERFLWDVEIFLPVGDKGTLERGDPLPSLVPLFAAAGGIAGIAAGLFITIWPSKKYPLMTGGKPIVSLPPYLVITFEVAILFAALATVLGFLLLARLPRLRLSSTYRQELAIDRYALLVRCPVYGAPLRAESALREAGATEILPLYEEETGLMGEPP